MIKVTITNDILNSIIEIELKRYKISLVELSQNVLNKLRKNSKIKSSYASNKIEGNPLSEKQAEEVRAFLMSTQKQILNEKNLFQKWKMQLKVLS